MNEREAIVAWLRSEAQFTHSQAVQEADRDHDPDYLAALVNVSMAYANAAEVISRGDHLKGQTDDR